MACTREAEDKDLNKDICHNEARYFRYIISRHLHISPIDKVRAKPNQNKKRTLGLNICAKCSFLGSERARFQI